MKVTSDTVLVPVTIQIKNRDVTFQNKDGVERGTVNIFGRVTTLTGRIVQTFEDTVQVDVPVELLPSASARIAIVWTSWSRTSTEIEPEAGATPLPSPTSARTN